jgi:hypothetical protein
MRIIASIFLTVVILLDAAHEVHAQAGSSGLSFLKLGVSGQGVALGDAVTAGISGAAAAHYNPAGLAAPNSHATSTQLLVMHKEWVQDTRTQFLGASVFLGERSALGFGVNSTTVSDVEIRTRPGTPEGTFTARSAAFSLSYAQQFADDLRLGATAKFLYEKILVDEASGFGFDIGMQWQTPVDQLSVGAVVANLGSTNPLRNESTRLPSMLRVGSAYALRFGEIPSVLNFSMDFNHVFPDSKSILAAGTEFLFEKTVAGRVGYQFGADTRGFSAGAGVTYGIFTLDYAFGSLSSDLGSTHTISLNFHF